jgi:hypothetical protein
MYSCVPSLFAAVQDQDSQNAQYLTAEASGQDGEMFLKKLQRMWFVMEHKGETGVYILSIYLSLSLPLCLCLSVISLSLYLLFACAGVAKQASQLATELQIASFPEPVKSAIDTSV